MTPRLLFATLLVAWSQVCLALAVFNTLTVTVTAGGQVTSIPPGIADCTADTCMATYPYDAFNKTQVLLTATSSPGYTFMGWTGACTGTGTCTVSMFQDQSVNATFSGSFPVVNPQAGYWYNPAEAGRGFTLEQNASSGNVFLATYLYSANGNPVWYAAGPAQMSGNTFSAPLVAFDNGQTLNGNWQQAGVGTSPGNVSITFTDAADATLTWPGGTVPIQRFAIVPGGLTATPAATQPQAGYWYNPAEGGRGYTIEVQGNTAFIAAYMYDANGNPVWYASGPATLTANNTFQGQLIEFSGGQTLTGTYQAPTGTANAGNITLQFTSPTAGTLTLPDGKSITIERFAF